MYSSPQPNPKTITVDNAGFAALGDPQDEGIWINNAEANLIYLTEKVAGVLQYVAKGGGGGSSTLLIEQKDAAGGPFSVNPLALTVVIGAVAVLANLLQLSTVPNGTACQIKNTNPGGGLVVNVHPFAGDTIDYSASDFPVTSNQTFVAGRDAGGGGVLTTPTWIRLD